MLVGVFRVELFVPDSSSLKTKRFVLSSIKKRIRNKFNVSVSEIGNNSKWQIITLGISMISNERKFIDQNVTGIINLLNSDGRMEILNQVLEIY